MNKIIRFYNKNRRIIWIFIVVTIGIIALMSALQKNYKSKDEEEKRRRSSSTNSTTTSSNNYSIITRKEITEDTNKNLLKIIDDFMNYCNNGQIEKAYELLSDDCKNTLFENIDIFKENYYNNIFSEYRLYSVQAWIVNEKEGYTYQVEITDDILSKGQSSLDMSIIDYFTIVMQNGEYKLNINNYIGKQNINFTGTQDNIEIYIPYKKSYADYEVYQIQIRNNNNFNILLDTKKYEDKMYLLGETGQAYGAFVNELTTTDLEVKSNSVKTINVKFNKSYNPKYGVEALVFSDMTINYGTNEEQKGTVKIDFK